MALQAGIRTLHEVGPEIKRAISSDILPVTCGEQDDESFEEEPCYEGKDSFDELVNTVFGFLIEFFYSLEIELNALSVQMMSQFTVEDIHSLVIGIKCQVKKMTMIPFIIVPDH